MSDVALRLTREPFGSNSDVIIMPDGHVPVFQLHGASLISGTATLQSEVSNPTRWWIAEEAQAHPKLAYYWDKWIDNTSGTTWDQSDRATLNSPAGAQWRSLVPKIGSTAGNGGGQLYSVDRDISPSWGFARSLYGKFQYANGEVCTPYIVLAARAGTTIGPNSLGAQTSWSPTLTGGAYEWVTEHYLKPAINAIIADGKTPVHCGIINCNGTFDAAGPDAFGGALAGLDTGLADNMTALRRAFEAFLSIGPVPYVGHILFQPDPSVASINYANVEIGQEQQQVFKRREVLADFFDASDVPRDASDDTHHTADGTLTFGARAADTWLDMVRSNRVIAPELTTIS